MIARALLLAVNLIVLLAFALAVYDGMMRYNSYMHNVIDWEMSQQQVP